MKSKKKKIFLIAEIACAHNGNYSRLKKIIQASSFSGVDAIQLQIWKLKFMMSPKNINYNKIKHLEFSYKFWEKIIKSTKKKYPKIEIYVCPYESISLKYFIKNKFIDGIKVNSSDLSNPYFLKHLRKFKKKINLSVGGSTVSEIEHALKVLRKNKKNITLMYGVQNFPTKVQDINLNYITYLKKHFNTEVGYQDHCNGLSKEAFYLPLISLSKGASVIEQHISLDRNKKGFDYQSSLLPKQFKEFTYMIRLYSKVSSNKAKDWKLSSSDLKYRKFQKKTIVLNKDKKKNSILRETDMIFLRDNRLGIKPTDYKKYIGKKFKTNQLKYSQLKPQNFVK